MQPVGLANTRISTACVQKSPRSLFRSIHLIGRVILEKLHSNTNNDASSNEICTLLQRLHNTLTNAVRTHLLHNSQLMKPSLH